MIRDIFATIGLVTVIAYASVWAAHWWETRYPDELCDCSDPFCIYH